LSGRSGRIGGESPHPEKCWEGEAVEITRRADKVWLQFRLSQVTTCPDNFAVPDGWYTD